MTADSLCRLSFSLYGAVQGVGFRPFVYRLAVELGLTGWVRNFPGGLRIEVEGPASQTSRFQERLNDERPPMAFIQSLETSSLDPKGYARFEVLPSEESGEKMAFILPDVATCPACLKELLDPGNRRYRYPFITCAHCGPRFSIIQGLPYDRSKTTLKDFPLCSRCEAEFEDPQDRRFHAQATACPECGPRLEWWDTKGTVLSQGAEALSAAVQSLREGHIVALKGIGGFQLLVCADDEAAVSRLRARKKRQEKPFALMFSAVDQVLQHVRASLVEERLLRAPEAPVVILDKLEEEKGRPLSHAVAPGQSTLGVMLPYSPLHHLLLAELGVPVVATSGNLSNEPLCIDEREALQRLAGIADGFLVHNRPIARPVDDSVARVMAGRPMMIRRARGYAPLPIQLKTDAPPAMAVGAHLKNTVAFGLGRQAFVSQHIGDLESIQAWETFEDIVADFQTMYGHEPQTMVCDEHPNYLSTGFAQRTRKPVLAVQHHYAHVLSAMGDNALDAPVLGIAWDGTGYGLDGTIWGGEFFHVKAAGFERVARLRLFRLPGGEQAVREPRRSALGLMFEAYGDSALAKAPQSLRRAFTTQEIDVLQDMWKRRINAPLTSSTGRLFDAIAGLLGIRGKVTYEGQAPMELESLAAQHPDAGAYSVQLIADTAISLDPLRPRWTIDWAPALEEILADHEAKKPVGLIAARFHFMLVEAMILIAQRMNLERVVLSGGCFQNRLLLERAVERLREENFRPYWHQRVPPNDGGLSLGQLMAAARAYRVEDVCA